MSATIQPRRTRLEPPFHTAPRPGPGTTGSPRVAEPGRRVELRSVPVPTGRQVAATGPTGPHGPTGPVAAPQPRSSRGRVSEREAEVLRLIARGRSNAEIAAELFIALPMVKSHVASLLGKLGARDRVQLVVAAYESGFVIPRHLAREQARPVA